MSKADKNNIALNLKKFWRFLWHDESLASYVLNLVLAFVIIKFLFFPGLSFLLNNDYPVVAIVSGSMEHKITDHRICDKFVVDVKNKRLSFQEFWDFCGDYYEKDFNITKEQFSSFDYNRGLYIGDVMVLYGRDPAKIKVGDILVFEPGDRDWFLSHGPVIHRVVEKWQDDVGKYHFKTKGDHNKDSSTMNNFESDIPEERVIGVAVVRVPFLGYVKIWLVDALSFVIGVFR